MDPNIDPAFLRGLTQRRFSRRDAIRYAGVGAAGVSLSAILAACGASTSEGAGGGGASASTQGFDWASQTLHHELNFANWPYYIDTSHGTHPTLDTFTQQTDIKVNYKPVINDNQAFYAKIKPFLEQGKPTGWDLMVLTNGVQLSQLIDNGWLIPLDLSKLPNFNANASSSIKDPAYDKGNTYTVAWQSGLTGIAFSPQATQALGREPNSVNDLFDPAVTGHVGMM